jgi:AmiR/NasT family two-component response regulator
MVLAQLGVPVQEAFVRLRAHAFATRRSLDEVARDVVARRLVFTDDMA